MIIKGKARANGAKLADYLLKEQKNERAELLEMRGWNVPTLKDAFAYTEEITRATQCENPFYHVSFRAAPGEELTPEQWQHCADKLEKRLGLEDHHRALVLHTYKGETHLHVVWDRIDDRTLKAAELSFDFFKCKEVARELERELGLQKVRNHKREDERELAAPSFGEDQEARRKGQDLKETRAAIREAWEKSEDGRSFAAALKERGLSLAQGERRDFVAVDERGSVHSIGKRTTGATAAEVREKLSDLDRERIPTVEKVREEQKRELAKEHDRENLIERAKAELTKEAEREEQKKREESRAAKLGATLYDRADMVSMQRDAMKDLGERTKERPAAMPQAKRDDDRQEQQRREMGDDENKRRQTREEEKPRYKSVAERVAEDRARSIAEADRRRSLTPAQRLEEDRQRDERERQLDRSGRERGRERER